MIGNSSVGILKQTPGRKEVGMGQQCNQARKAPKRNDRLQGHTAQKNRRKVIHRLKYREDVIAMHTKVAKSSFES
jgi:hypothetical protein